MDQLIVATSFKITLRGISTIFTIAMCLQVFESLGHIMGKACFLTKVPMTDICWVIICQTTNLCLIWRGVNLFASGPLRKWFSDYYYRLQYRIIYKSHVMNSFHWPWWGWSTACWPCLVWKKHLVIGSFVISCRITQHADNKVHAGRFTTWQQKVYCRWNPFIRLWGGHPKCNSLNCPFWDVQVILSETI